MNLYAVSAVVPIIIPREGINLSLDSPVVQLVIMSLLFASTIYCVESFIKFIIYIIRRFKK